MPENDLSNIDWHSLLRIDQDDVLSWFDEVGSRYPDDNTTIRFYSIKCLNGKPDYQGLIEYFLSQATRYVLEEKEILELIEDGDDPQKAALGYFGDIDPRTDGKYGELILYILVEGILQIPMVVHKLGQLYNKNDQVKGSDGLFVGSIDGETALMIGESKMRNSWFLCLRDAVESIERYLNDDEDRLHSELHVAKKHLSKDIQNLGIEALDNLYEAFRTKQSAFTQLTIRYPVLLIYRENRFRQLFDSEEGDIEPQILDVITRSFQRKENSVVDKISQYDECQFDFFLLPCNNVNSFRELCYKVFHDGKEFPRQ